MDRLTTFVSGPAPLVLNLFVSLPSPFKDAKEEEEDQSSRGANSGNNNNSVE